MLSILSTVHQIKELMQVQREAYNLCDIWNRVCYRLDVYLLTLTEGINLIIFFWWLSLTE